MEEQLKDNNLNVVEENSKYFRSLHTRRDDLPVLNPELQPYTNITETKQLREDNDVDFLLPAASSDLNQQKIIFRKDYVKEPTFGETLSVAIDKHNPSFNLGRLFARMVEPSSEADSKWDPEQSIIDLESRGLNLSFDEVNVLMQTENLDQFLFASTEMEINYEANNKIAQAPLSKSIPATMLSVMGDPTIWLFPYTIFNPALNVTRAVNAAAKANSTAKFNSAINQVRKYDVQLADAASDLGKARFQQFFTKPITQSTTTKSAAYTNLVRSLDNIKHKKPFNSPGWITARDQGLLEIGREAVLHSTQYDRDIADSLINIFGVTAISGIIGKVGLNKITKEQQDEILKSFSKTIVDNITTMRNIEQQLKNKTTSKPDATAKPDTTPKPDETNTVELPSEKTVYKKVTESGNVGDLIKAKKLEAEIRKKAPDLLDKDDSLIKDMEKSYDGEVVLSGGRQADLTNKMISLGFKKVEEIQKRWIANDEKLTKQVKKIMDDKKYDPAKGVYALQRLATYVPFFKRAATVAGRSLGSDFSVIKKFVSEMFPITGGIQKYSDQQLQTPINSVYSKARHRQQVFDAVLSTEALPEYKKLRESTKELYPKEQDLEQDIIRAFLNKFDPQLTELEIKSPKVTSFVNDTFFSKNKVSTQINQLIDELIELNGTIPVSENVRLQVFKQIFTRFNLNKILNNRQDFTNTISQKLQQLSENQPGVYKKVIKQKQGVKTPNKIVTPQQINSMHDTIANRIVEDMLNSDGSILSTTFKDAKQDVDSTYINAIFDINDQRWFDYLNNNFMENISVANVALSSPIELNKSLKNKDIWQDIFDKPVEKFDAEPFLLPIFTPKPSGIDKLFTLLEKEKQIRINTKGVNKEKISSHYNIDKDFLTKLIDSVILPTKLNLNPANNFFDGIKHLNTASLLGNAGLDAIGELPSVFKNETTAISAVFNFAKSTVDVMKGTYNKQLLEDFAVGLDNMMLASPTRAQLYSDTSSRGTRGWFNNFKYQWDTKGALKGSTFGVFGNDSMRALSSNLVKYSGMEYFTAGYKKLTATMLLNQILRTTKTNNKNDLKVLRGFGLSDDTIEDIAKNNSIDLSKLSNKSQNQLKIAIHKTADTTITTPSPADLPIDLLRSDSFGTMTRLLMQFTSFMFGSSNQHLPFLISSQARSSAWLGVAMSVPIMALIYQLRAHLSTEGQKQEETWTQFLAQGLFRSYSFAMFSYIDDHVDTITENSLSLRSALDLHSWNTPRFGSEPSIIDLAGPTFGRADDLLKAISSMSSDLSNFESPINQNLTRLFISVLPYQNLWWLRPVTNYPKNKLIEMADGKSRLPEGMEVWDNLMEDFPN